MRPIFMSIIALLAFACIAEASPVIRIRANVGVQPNCGISMVYGQQAIQQQVVLPQQIAAPCVGAMQSLNYGAQMLSGGYSQQLLGVQSGYGQQLGINAGYGGLGFSALGFRSLGFRQRAFIRTPTVRIRIR